MRASVPFTRMPYRLDLASTNWLLRDGGWRMFLLCETASKTNVTILS